MNSNTYRKSVRFLICALVILCVAICSLITLGGVLGGPDWDDVFSFFGVAPEKISIQSDFVRFIDIGQGDCELICSNGNVALIDSGPPDNAKRLVSKLRKTGIKNIDVLSISHFHDDHYGGIEAVCDKFNIRNLIIPDILKTEKMPYEITNVSADMRKNNGNVYTAVQGMNTKVGDFEITVLGYFPDADNENERSVVTVARIDDKKFLFTGDMGKSTEKLLLKENLNLDCDVLKAGHHGSSNSTSKEFFNACTPEYAVISCEKNNQYSHPHRETLDLFNKNGVKILRTDKNGDITFEVKDGEFEITCEK